MDTNNIINTKKFELNYDDNIYIGEIIKMYKSLFIWIGKSDMRPNLGSIIIGMETRFDNIPLTTTLLPGDTLETELISNTIAKRLSKKFHIQAFVSSPLNISDPICIEKIIEKIIENI